MRYGSVYSTLSEVGTLIMVWEVGTQFVNDTYMYLVIIFVVGTVWMGSNFGEELLAEELFGE